MACEDFLDEQGAMDLKTNAETINEVVTSGDDYTPPAIDGEAKLTLKGFENKATTAIKGFENKATTAISGAGYQVVGDFADAGKVEITNDNQVYTSKSIAGSEDALWRTNQALPYTPTGSDPSASPELEKWVVVAQGELKSAALAAGTSYNNIMYSIDTVTPIVGFIFVGNEQKTYTVPADAIGETIVSVIGNQLETDVSSPATYTLMKTSVLSVANPKSFGATGASDDEAVQATYDYANLHDIPVEWDDDSYDISVDITGTDTVEHTGGIPTFTNYTIKEVFPNSLFAGQQDTQRLFKNRIGSGGTVPTIVITGDSLSYNHQDFDAVARQTPQECAPGMNSWSFTLRDAILRNDENFKHADEVPYTHNTGVTDLGTNGQTQFSSPFNGRLKAFRASDSADTIKIHYRHTGHLDTVYMWFLKNPTGSSCSVDVNVNGVNKISSFDLGGTTVSDPYQGKELFFLEVPSVTRGGVWNEIELTNFVNTAVGTADPTNLDIYFMGISANFTEIHQTGKGGQSSQWVVDNLASAVTDFAPDLFIMTIGANDSWTGNPQGFQSVQDYEANLNAIYDGVETANGNARSILISPPHTSESVVPNADMQRYINKGREVAYQRGVLFLDMQELWSTVPVDAYRFDSIHYTKQGNTVLVNKIASILGLRLAERLDCVNSFGDYVDARPVTPSERIFTSYDGASFSRVELGFTDSLDVIESIEKINDYTIKVNLGVNSSLIGSLTVRQFDANGLQQITASPQNYFFDFVYFQLRKQDGSQLVLADWTTYLSSLKFIVEAS